MTPKDVHILLVEDDEKDSEAVVRAFKKRNFTNPLTIVPDGVEAFAVLQREIKHPYLILLDLNMPRMSGLEFLQRLRQDPLLRRSIVFVLTTSDREEDKLAAYDAQVAGYLVKARAGEDFTRVTDLLERYWNTVEFPPEGTL